MLLQPASCTEYPHMALLLQISQLMHSRSQHGLRAVMIIVKAPVGIQGNEEADRLANVAGNPSRCHMQVKIGNIAFEDRLWPSLIKGRKDADGATALAHSSRSPHYFQEPCLAQHTEGLTDPDLFLVILNVCQI